MYLIKQQNISKKLCRFYVHVSLGIFLLTFNLRLFDLEDSYYIMLKLETPQCAKKKQKNTKIDNVAPLHTGLHQIKSYKHHIIYYICLFRIDYHEVKNFSCRCLVDLRLNFYSCLETRNHK